jgi:hypothetical protein
VDLARRVWGGNGLGTLASVLQPAGIPAAFDSREIAMQSRLYSRVALPLLVAGLMLCGTRDAAAQEQRTIPAGTVVHVTLDEPLTSETARIGQRVTATVSPLDLSGFPTGTRFEGVVAEVQRAAADRPAILNVRWFAVTMPNPDTYPVDGTLYRLDPEYVYRDETGRLYTAEPEGLTALERQARGFDPIWVGYGAGAGAILGTILGGGLLRGALLGGLGGAIYGAIRGGVFGQAEPGPRVILAAAGAQQRPLHFHEVRLPRGEPFGIRLGRPVTFAARETYRYPALAEALKDGRVLGARQGLYNTTAVRLNGRALAFERAKPVSVNGVLYLPWEPIAAAAQMRTDFPLGPAGGFYTIQTPRGPVKGHTGLQTVWFQDQQWRLQHAPITINGEL